MSLNPAIGHLYHDFSISNAYTALDAKEKFRTRQINAREDKQLGKYNKSLERAKTICKRRREWETLLIRQQLKAIHSRTPSLDRGLKQEEERRKRFNEQKTKSTGNLSRNTTSLGTRNSVTSYRSGTTGTRSSLFNIDGSYSKNTCNGVFTGDDDDVFDDYVFKSLPNQINTEDSNKFIKRSEHVTRALDKVYRRHRERTASNLNAWEILKQDNADILDNARVYLKDTDTLRMLETILLLSNNNDRSSTGEQNDTDSKDGIAHKDDTESSAERENDTSATDDVFTSGRTENKAVTNDESKMEDKLPEINNNVRFNNSDEDSDEIISSTIANPSEASAGFSKEQSKWTEIFRMPELWRQYDKTQDHIKNKKGKKQAVVHTGRYKARIKLKDYDNFVR